VQDGLFSLGRWGLPVNAVAVLYGAAMVVNLAWPRPEVYDPTGEHPWLVWSAPAVVLAVLVLGGVARAVARASALRRSALPEPAPAAG
jgi:TRAP-type mannitol/chloroaromatic compound transport system permease small subunit